MKVKNKSFQHYSICESKVNINCFLLVFIIVSPFISCYSWNIFNPFTKPPSNVTIESTVYCNTYCQFKCDKKCIDKNLVCDGINDCDDGYDEYGCPENYSIDFNPYCVKDNCYRWDVISETERQRNCTCIKISFNEPPNACKRNITREPFLIFSNLHNLYKVNLPEYPSKEGARKKLSGFSNQITFFEYRIHEDLLIWLDPIENKIFTGKVDISQKFPGSIYERKVVVDVATKINGFVYNWKYREIIWIDETGINSLKIDPKTYSVRRDKKTYHTIKNTKSGYVGYKSIAIDVNRQYIFVVMEKDNGNDDYFDGRIYRIDLTDSRQGDIVLLDWTRKHIAGLAVDTKNARLYWMDGEHALVNSINYDGSNHVIINEMKHFDFPGSSKILYMDIHSNYLYFTEKNEGRIFRINLNKTDSKYSEKIVEISYGPTLNVKVIDPKMQYY